MLKPDPKQANKMADKGKRDQIGMCYFRRQKREKGNASRQETEQEEAYILEKKAAK